LWHRRLGHLGSEALSKLISSQAISCNKPKRDHLCHACQLGRHVRLPFESSNSHAVNKFDLIHCDLWTSPVVSVSGYKYYLVIVDDCTHYIYFTCYFLCALLQVDPFLCLIEDCRLRAIDSAAEPCTKLYGSKEDDDLALKSLSNIDMNEDQSKETSVSLIFDSLEDLSEVPAQKIMICMLFLML
jgi:hypothetical protein